MKKIIVALGRAEKVLRRSLNYGPYLSNSEELFVPLLWIVRVQVE